MAFCIIWLTLDLCSAFVVSLTCTFCPLFPLLFHAKAQTCLRARVKNKNRYIGCHFYHSSSVNREFYSFLKLFTGFAIAAFIAWKLIVNNATNVADKPAMINTSHPILILYAKFSSHLCIPHHATGNATSAAIKINFKKSFESMATIFPTLAPSTFRMLISLVRCCVV